MFTLKESYFLIMDKYKDEDSAIKKTLRMDVEIIAIIVFIYFINFKKNENLYMKYTLN